MMIRRSALALAAGFVLASLATTDADAALANNRSFASGNYVLDLDGKSQVFVSGVDGGGMVMEALSEPTPRGIFTKKRPSTPKFDPLEMQISPANVTAQLLPWLSGSTSSAPAPAGTAALSALDLNAKETSRRQFRNLRVTELTFPELDGASKEAGTISVEAIAEAVTEAKGSGAVNSSVGSKAQQRWTSSSFSVAVPGLDTSRISRVSPITVKFAASGGGKDAGKADVSTFSVTLPETSAEGWKKWHADTSRGGNGDANEKTMAIEYLTPTQKGSFLRLTLEGVGILAVEAEAGTDQVRRVKAVLYAEAIRVEPGKP